MALESVSAACAHSDNNEKYKQTKQANKTARKYNKTKQQNKTVKRNDNPKHQHKTAKQNETEHDSEA